MALGMLVVSSILFNAAKPGAAAQASDTGKKPNIIYIMGDDIGWFNIGVYNQG